MTSPPPREGARWGDDPKPVPVAEPQPPPIPAEYARLCREYGEAHVQKALKIRAKVQHEYPHIKVLHLDEYAFVDRVLTTARHSIEEAARDGRQHTMPETLDRIDDVLGGQLATKTGLIDHFYANSMIVRYGDEDKGRAARRNALNIMVVIIAIILGAIICYFASGGNPHATTAGGSGGALIGIFLIKIIR